jgi:hypothetical protein
LKPFADFCGMAVRAPWFWFALALFREQRLEHQAHFEGRKFLMSVIKYLAAGAALAVFCTLGVVRPAVAQSRSKQSAKTQGQLDIAAPRAERKAIVGGGQYESSARPAE